MKKRIQTLVRNDAGQIQILTCNLLPKLVRHDTMEERDYLVVPMIILTEGVHSGSDGPLYYSPKELSKTPAAWNHKPIVVYHPEMNGVGVSACDPDIITSRKVGLMMNTKYVKGKGLKSEAWLEKDRADKVDLRIMEAVEAGTMMELSTGVFVDAEETTGEWNGEEYVGVATNFRPDHLALLPDKIGACSIQDGAGFLRNAKGSKDYAMSVVKRALARAGLLDNEMSHSNIYSSLSTVLRKKFNANTEGGPFLWVADVYSDFVIYEFNGKLFRVGYTSDDTGVALDDAGPTEVVRVTEYRTVAGAFVGNQDQTTEIPMNKKQLVDNLIGKGGWVEDDRAALMAMNEAQLARIKLPEPAPAPKAPETPPATNTPAAPVAPAAPTNIIQLPPKPQTVEEYVANAPKQVQDVLRDSMSIHNEEKGRLVTEILANKECQFSKEDLEARPLGELRNLARLAGVKPAPRNYSGQAPVDTTTANEAEAPLEMPALNYAKA